MIIRNGPLSIVDVCFIDIPGFNANSVKPDQTPHSAAFDLGLHFLQMFLSWDDRHKRVHLYQQQVTF